MKKYIAVLIFGFCLFSYTNTQAQKSGFMPVNRIGVSYQDVLGLDVGLVSYNILFGRKSSNFFDVSLGGESIFAKPFVLAPKLNFDLGFEILNSGLTFGGGVDVAIPTDFSNTTLMITPKAGISIGSFIRLYYGYNFIQNKTHFPEIGNHRISLEVNIAAFHDFKIGL